MTGLRHVRVLGAAILLWSAVALTGCGGLTDMDMSGEGTKAKTNKRYDEVRATREQKGGVFTGKDGTLDLFNTNAEEKSGGGGTLGVNSFLWRATLDTISFMPLVSTDPFGGVILTDWYADPQTPDERFKLNVFISATELRADALKVTAFKQVKNAKGQWTDVAMASQTVTDIENAILTRARRLRNEKLEQQDEE